MPVAKIHVHEGAFDDSELSAIGLTVQAALEEVLSVPPEDYFRVTHVLPKGQFVHTPAFVGCTYSERLVLLASSRVARRRSAWRCSPRSIGSSSRRWASDRTIFSS
jgi:hypothetical protein